MTPILYFTTFTAALVLFAGVIALSVWLLVKLIRLPGRIYSAVVDPPSNASAQEQKEFEGWHPAHLKRAGQ